MFGKNKTSMQKLELLLGTVVPFAKETADNRSVFDAGCADLEDSQKQMEKNVLQVVDNTKSTSRLAEQNTGALTDMSHEIHETVKRMEIAEEEYRGLSEEVRELSGHAERVVDQSKHLTTPSKAISESLSALEGNAPSYRSALGDLLDVSKQMSVLSLNCAIEAGRLGDTGKAFVGAAEEVRVVASGMESKLSELIRRQQEDQDRIEKLSEQVQHLFGMLKENNAAMTNILKESQSIRRIVDHSSIKPFSGQITELREQTIGIRNMEEEIQKLQERNKIQLEDITSEVAAQKKSLLDLSDEMIPMFSHAKECCELIEGKE